MKDNGSKQTILNSIYKNRDSVYPNIIDQLNIRNNEDIRMELNQTHYGSLKVSRDVRNLKEAATIYQTKNHNRKVIFEFLESFRHQIEPSVLAETVKVNDNALSLVLGIIHHKTLERGDSTKLEGHTTKKNLRLRRLYYQTHKSTSLRNPKLNHHQQRISRTKSSSARKLWKFLNGIG